MKTNILAITALLFIILSINAVSATEESYIVPINSHITANTSIIFNITDPSEVLNITNRPDFKTWAASNGINPNGCMLEIVSPNSSANNLIEVCNTTHKWFYSVKQDMIYDDANEKNDTETHNIIRSALNSNANHFKIVNRCGKTVNRVGVTYYRFWHDIPVQIASSQRYNLKNGKTLNYNPSPEFSEVSISIDVDNLGWWRTTPDIYKYAIPLKTWHTATIKKGKGYYLYFT
jgi:hypothetical protein